MLLIRNGRIIDPSQEINATRDLLLREGRIAEIGEPGKINARGAELIDASGLIVAPGFIDIHVHLREPGQSHKETIATGTQAASAGGFTAVCTMPNTLPVNDSPQITRWMQSPERGAAVNVFPIAAASVGSLGEQLTDFARLREAGAVAFTDDGKPILGDDIMRQALMAAKAFGVPVVQHAEDTRLTGGCSMNLSATSFRLGLRGMPVEAESGLVERDIQLVRETGGRLHVAHLSTRKALDAVRHAKRDGLPVTCEVTPHHIALTDEAVSWYDTNYKMNPPLRSASDRGSLIEGLLDGSIDAIATDHAPHALHEKQQEFDRAPMGITGLETSLGLALRVLLVRGAPLSRVVELLSTHPAQIMNLTGRGSLAAGAHADVTIFDPNARWTYQRDASRSKSKNSPFDGWEMHGKVRYTIVGGRVVFRNNEN